MVSLCAWLHVCGGLGRSLVDVAAVAHLGLIESMSQPVRVEARCLDSWLMVLLHANLRCCWRQGQ